MWPSPYPGGPPLEAYAYPLAARRSIVVADASALISDVLRRTRGHFSLMPWLAAQNFITLLAPEHIDSKVYLRLTRACEDGGYDYEEAIRTYETLYRPYLRLVEVGELVLDDPRVAFVAIQDEEDIPVAQLGVLLAPALVLTQDKHLLRSGIGVRQWADGLVLLKGVTEVDQLARGGALGVSLAARLSYAGVSQIARFLARNDIALGVTLGVGIAAALFYRPHMRHAADVMKREGGPAIENVMLKAAEALERRDGMEAALQPSLIKPSRAESLEASLARILAQHADPIPAATICQRVTYGRHEIERNVALDVLHREPAFRFLPGRGWMLGRPAGPPAQATVAAPPALASTASAAPAPLV